MNAALLFSLFGPDSQLPGAGKPGPAMREGLLVLGVLLLVVMAIIVGVILYRRRKRRHSKRHRHSGHRHGSHRTGAGMAELKQLVSEKTRHRHRHHRPRNPTLAETGGLPALRSDNAVEPPQPPADL